MFTVSFLACLYSSNVVVVESNIDTTIREVLKKVVYDKRVLEGTSIAAYVVGPFEHTPCGWYVCWLPPDYF